MSKANISVLSVGFLYIYINNILNCSFTIIKYKRHRLARTKGRDK